MQIQQKKLWLVSSPNSVSMPAAQRASVESEEKSGGHNTASLRKKTRVATGRRGSMKNEALSYKN
jgi:hypothetical protein